ncbi:MAG TPA: hypothetical protein VI386_13500 [Candidatus Sulfotelmatobacter sp.]
MLRPSTPMIPKRSRSLASNEMPIIVELVLFEGLTPTSTSGVSALSVAYDWIDDSMVALRGDFLPKNLKPELERNDFPGSVAVQGCWR